MVRQKNDFFGYLRRLPISARDWEPFDLILFLFFVTMTASAAAATAALRAAGAAIGTANAFFAAFFCLDDIGKRSANDQCDDANHDPINQLHTRLLSNLRDYALCINSFNEYSSLICLFLRTIRTARMAAKSPTIAHPTIGIQVAPKFCVVKSVPKK